MVAMFRYSEVAVYTVAMPPQKLEFNSSMRQGHLIRETENVCTLKSYLCFCHTFLCFLMVPTGLSSVQGLHKRHVTFH